MTKIYAGGTRHVSFYPRPSIHTLTRCAVDSSQLCASFELMRESCFIFLNTFFLRLQPSLPDELLSCYYEKNYVKTQSLTGPGRDLRVSLINGSTVLLCFHSNPFRSCFQATK